MFLGIETSCDDTAGALLSLPAAGGPPVVAAERLSSQTKLHEPYGGVVPELAAREHMRNLPIIVAELFAEAKISAQDLEAIVVTQGPGLKGCLLMGLAFAKGLSLASGRPLIGVNHIEGHLFAPLLDNPELDFPFLALVVSGGHTEIVEVRGLRDYRVWARTIDDAAGEAFDKSANLLGCPYPGGALLAQLADRVTASEFTLPRVMREAEGFSFSGLKTASALLIERNERCLGDDEMRSRLAFAVQEAIVDALVYKLKKVIAETGIRTVAVTGGVSANRRLREAVSALAAVRVFFPQRLHCTDNGAMIAYVGALRFRAGERSALTAQVYSRWPVEELSISNGG